MTDVRFGVVRGIGYGLFGPPGEFVPQARALGASLVRSYVFWGGVEPAPGQYTWDAVDALLSQVDGDDEVWLTVCSSSPWGTREATDFLPPSPPHDLSQYGSFVRALVARCGGRVKYWQCDNEPSNGPLLWAGSAPEYVAQLREFFAAVKSVDPEATVVLGGCGYDVHSSPAGSPPRQFFDHLVSAGRDHFDAFSVHLYGRPEAIPSIVDDVRSMMRAHGYEKPVVAGEYAGPVLFEFPELDPVVQEAFAAAFAGQEAATQSTEELAALAGQDTPERRAMVSLSARMAQLPPRLQMFLPGCPPELAAKRDRINARQVVIRNVLALASGVRVTAYWNLAPEVPGPVDPHQMMYLMFGKLPLLDYDESGALTVRHPAADAFAAMTAQLSDAVAVTKVPLAGHPTVEAYEVTREGRGPVFIAWVSGDPFDGEDEPPVTVELPGPVKVEVSATPVFVDA
ncbi:hypothetical protein [Labedaea rhizosphaerae]|uniref:Glycosyl hydrolase family 39 n=1 Tax=Labedaea rhizosphaerae TaxID=598644 RepID=A0A4R6S692_LABRH|nr:hypothetical protein [Labedaea rhizosphaerae]TDP95201.1 hypothetical protein EV186_105433 [Labedaea rhizosphaerae]